MIGGGGYHHFSRGYVETSAMRQPRTSPSTTIKIKTAKTGIMAQPRDTVPTHVRFSEATKVQALDANTYKVDLRDNYCIGSGMFWSPPCASRATHSPTLVKLVMLITKINSSKRRLHSILHAICCQCLPLLSWPSRRRPRLTLRVPKQDFCWRCLRHSSRCETRQAAIYAAFNPMARWSFGP